MKNNSARPPIIIIGMHRSGTSMIARMLETIGLFIGKKKERHHEAQLFLQINNWLIHQSGGAWDYPEPIHHLLVNKEARSLAVDYIKYIMKTPHVLSYLGWGKYLSCRTPLKLNIPWGWKDPRNTYTLPIWIDLFPDAKVIHIYRHGVDVANSLRLRQKKKLTASEKALHNMKIKKLLYWLVLKRYALTNTLRCATLEGGFSLWEEYIKKARANIRNLQGEVMELKYEDCLAEPFESLKSLAHFCDLPSINDRIVSKLARQVENERAYAYRNEFELQIFADRVANRLRKRGY